MFTFYSESDYFSPAALLPPWFILSMLFQYNYNCFPYTFIVPIYNISYRLRKNSAD